MDATLHILKEAGARIDIDTIEIGEKVYLSGNTTGIAPESWDSLRRTRVFLKAPITTPQGGGYKSLNVTARKMMGLYANIRPCVSYFPYVDTKHPKMDVVIVRENEEDTYGGIEHRLTDQVTQCLKLITRPGSEKIVRYAFEYARAYKRKKVTCFVKDNIMKLTDGLFHKIFEELAPQDFRRSGTGIPGYRGRPLDCRHRRRQACRHAGEFRRARNAQPLWRCLERCRGADRRICRPGRLR
jgi:isocitrate dehydrogenase